MSRQGAQGRAVAAALALVAAAACSSDDDRPAAGESLALRLTRALRFPQSEIIEGLLPDPTDMRATLLPLGPTVKVLPGESDLMALRVEDPAQRAIEATLIQFSDAPSYVRVEVEEGDGAYLVENDFTADSDLCEGLCDAIFTVTVTEAIEFADGGITQVSTRQIVVDCREHGDREACDGSAPGGGASEQFPCGDVTAGEIAWTSDPVLDAHLEAVRLLSDASAVLTDTIDEIREDMAAELELAQSAGWAMVESALVTEIEQHTQGGLTGTLGEQGCALRFAQVQSALRSCDGDAADALSALDCSGVCQPSGDAAACEDAPSRGCRGVLDAAECAGRCVGTCEIELEEPAACAGTCRGECDGECPGGGAECSGPCTGACTGTCLMPSTETCAGQCTGLCDVPADGVPDCEAPLAAYCAASSGEVLACSGDCFEPEMVAIGGGPCAASALAVARVLPRCESPVVQLSFAFRAGLDAADQDDFAALVQGMNAPLTRLVSALSRLALLIEANSELLDAAEGEIADSLADLPADPDPAQDPLACAQERIPEAAAWLAGQLMLLEQLRDDASLVQSATLSP